jgi:hypothetical protein
MVQKLDRATRQDNTRQKKKKIRQDKAEDKTRQQTRQGSRRDRAA